MWDSYCFLLNFTCTPTVGLIFESCVPSCRLPLAPSHCELVSHNVYGFRLLIKMLNRVKDKTLSMSLETSFSNADQYSLGMIIQPALDLPNSLLCLLHPTFSFLSGLPCVNVF